MTVTRKKFPFCFSYSVNGVPLTKTKHHKYLGITLSSDLRWDSHIANITSTALRKLLFIRRRLRSAPVSSKLLAYKTLVRPVLEYANTVWFPQSITNITKLEAIQRKALRIIHNKYKRTDSPTLLAASSSLQTLSARAKQARLKFLFQLLHEQYRIDVQKYVTYSQSPPSRHKHMNTLTEYVCHNDTFKHSFFPLSISEWNRLDRNITCTQSLSSFVSQIEHLS